MDMHTYWRGLPTAQRAALAESCDTQVVYLSQIAHGHRKASGRLTLRLEQATSGVVTRHDLRPDLYPPEVAASSEAVA